MLLDELVECSNLLFFATTLPTLSLQLWEFGVSSCWLPGVLVLSVVVEFVIAHLWLCWHSVTACQKQYAHIATIKLMYTVAYDECSKLILHSIVSKSMQSRQANSKSAWKFWRLGAFGMGDSISSSRDVLFGIIPSHSFWIAMNSQWKRRGTLQGRQCQHHPAEECIGLQCGGARRSKLQTTSHSIMNVSWKCYPSSLVNSGISNICYIQIL